MLHTYRWDQSFNGWLVSVIWRWNWSANVHHTMSMWRCHTHASKYRASNTVNHLKCTTVNASGSKWQRGEKGLCWSRVTTCVFPPPRNSDSEPDRQQGSWLMFDMHHGLNTSAQKKTLLRKKDKRDLKTGIKCGLYSVLVSLLLEAS